MEATLPLASWAVWITPFARLRAGSFARLRAGLEVGERLGEDPTGGIIGEADSADERIGPALQTAQGVAVAQLGGGTQHEKMKEATHDQPSPRGEGCWTTSL